MHILNLTDVDRVNEIYKKHYENEFPKPNFFGPQVISKFQVTEHDKIIVVGGVRLIPEIIILTDKDAPVLSRRTALMTALDFMVFQAQIKGFDNLHAFTKDEKWANRLKKSGFYTAGGEALVIDL